MTQSNTLFKLLIFILMPAFLLSQSPQLSINQRLNKRNSWIKIKDHSLSNEEFIKYEVKKLAIDSENNLKLTSVVKSKNNWNHYKYNQYYKDIPVLCGNFTLHKRNNELIKGSGNILPNINIETKPNLTPDIIIEIANNEVLSNQFKNSKSTIYKEKMTSTKPLLVIVDKQYPNFSGEYILAYEVDISFNTNLPHNDKIIINANTGEVIKTTPQICFINVDGIANTKYSGKQKVTVDSVAENKFLLQDLSRGEGIFTVNSYTNKVFTDNDNDWNNVNDFQDEAATDAHFGAISFYDFLKNRYNWNGLDNNGFELRSFVHYNHGESFVNAFWNGEVVSFGDGNCSNYYPLTSLDIVAHEFAHGLTEFSSGLIYTGESGALNESISDIFGKAIEYYYGESGTFNWIVGQKFTKHHNTNPFRSMKDPNLYDDPKFYKGEKWSEYQEVHTNSGVLNYWFYLLSEGGQGENEFGIPFDIRPIGIDKAIDLVFLMETAYLNPNSNYQHAKESSLQAANDLFGENSMEQKTIKEVWEVVGLFEPLFFENDLKISFSNKDQLLCGIDKLYEVKINISNNGYQTFPTGTVIPLEYHFERYGTKIYNLPENKEKITLTGNLIPGDTKQIVFAKKINFENFNASYSDLVVQTYLNDQNSLNNKALMKVLSKTKGKDLRLGIAYDYKNNCLTKDLKINIYISNSGCEPIPIGTKLIVNLTKPVLKTITFNLLSDLYPKQSINKEETINLTGKSGTIDLMASLMYQDNNNENNSVMRIIKVLKTINKNFKEDFSNYNSLKLNSKYLNLKFKSGIRFKLYNIQNDTMLAFIGGQFYDFNHQINECTNIDGFFKDYKSTYSIPIELCVDFEKFYSPKLNFDLIQNTVPNQDLEIPDSLRPICKISYPNDFTIPPKYIYNQNNKELKHFNLDMPEAYSGKVLIEMFSVYSKYDEEREVLLDSSDYIIIDDINISGTVLDKKNQVVIVYPNPGKGNINFKLINKSVKKYHLNIFNALGEIVHSVFTDNPITVWNSNNLSSGIYYFTIISSDKIMDSGKIIIEN